MEAVTARLADRLEGVVILALVILILAFVVWCQARREEPARRRQSDRDFARRLADDEELHVR